MFDSMFLENRKMWFCNQLNCTKFDAHNHKLLKPSGFFTYRQV